MFRNAKFSLWCDYLQRDFIDDEFAKLITDGVINGATSNPAIFKNAIVGSSAYDADKRALAGKNKKEIYESLVIKDIKNAASKLSKNYENGDDGFVSLEVDPSLSGDEKTTFEEGLRLFRAINMPNVMIKVPSTDAGFKAMSELLKLGVNVNATLVFSPFQTSKCLEAFRIGNAEFKKLNPAKELPKCVISVFVSRFDRVVDGELKKHNLPTAKFGIMNATSCYNLVERANLENVKTLFASTGVKGGDLEADYYIKSLKFKNSINTAPLDTLKKYAKNGGSDFIEPFSDGEIDEYFKAVRRVVDKNALFDELLDDGLEQFEVAFAEIINSL
ncbi:MAG: transaldolase [Campylobacter sp.]|nr:transaldolase [Campylobacter sp.]